MRLRRLDLVRYGKFSDVSIDFGPKPVAGPDFHIIFGLNEAGKSTVANGYLDLLYGIDERSRYSFLHDYASMRIDGVFEVEGAERAFSRIKQRGNSLLDETGRPVPEAAIAAHLAGLSRGDYAAMFSLDDETLEAGGKAILDSQGDLGQLLFAAGAGLAHASKTLSALDVEAEGLYRKHAQSTELAILKKRLGELKLARDAIDTLASSHEALEAERADAGRRYDEIVDERARLASRLQVIDRHVNAIPILVELDRKLATLAMMPELAPPPQAWVGSIRDLIRDDASAEAMVAANADELSRMRARIEAVEVDEAILAVSERVKALSDLKARHVSAGLDLPGRRVEQQILESSVASSLALLGRTSEPDPRTLLLPAATFGAVRAMVERRSAIVAALRAATDEASTAADALQAARDRVGQESAVSMAIRARLAAAVAAARDSGNAREMREARQSVDECRSQLETRLLALQPWSGQAHNLAIIEVPRPTDIAAWGEAIALDRARASVLARRAAELETTRRSWTDRLDAIRSAADLIDDNAAAALRALRDEAWARHREDLGGDTADAFVIVLKEDDGVGMRRLTHARDLEELRSAADSLAKTETALCDVRDELVGCRDALAAVAAEVREAIASLAGGRAMPSAPEHLLDVVVELVNARSSALEAWRALDLAERRLARAEDDSTRLLDNVMAAARGVGLVPSKQENLEGVMAVASSFLDHQATLDGQFAEARKTVTIREEDLAFRRRSVEAAERREAEWLADIADALAGTWLHRGLPAASVGSVLDQLNTLSKALQDRDSMRLRIDKMVEDRETFSREAAAVGALAGDVLGPDQPEQMATRLAERLEGALRTKAKREGMYGELAALEKRRDEFAAELIDHGRAKDEVLRVFDVDTLEEAARRLDLMRERAGIVAAIVETEERLVAQTREADIATSRSCLAKVDLVGLTVERAGIMQRLKDGEEALRLQLVRQARAADKLDAIGSDSAVARIDLRRRTVLLEIEDKALQYLRLRLGAMAARYALHDYRERHRSGMMSHASTAFAVMTKGAYTGLSSQPVKGGEVLIALLNDGRSKVADALSKGTRFQLYLALRLAGYHEFARLRPTVPFIADDIMETFDEIRSEEVFKLFGEMANIGQVVYLTHHRHLCEIARQVIPGVVIHELP